MSCGVDEYKRIKAIDDVFKLGYKFTVRELSIHLKLKNLHDPANAFSCGVSEKVLYKVLTAMKNELHVPLTKNLQNQYYYEIQYCAFSFPGQGNGLILFSCSFPLGSS